MSMLNVSGLARWLQKRGWKVDVLPFVEEELAPNQIPHVGALKMYDGDGYGFEIGVDSLMVAAMEFHMKESVETQGITVIEHAKAHGSIQGLKYQVAFPNTGKHAWD